MVDVKHYQNTDRHEQQGNGEQRVYLTDNLIYRQQSGKDIISENNNNPEGGIQAVGGQLGKQSGRPATKTAPTNIIRMTVKPRITCLVVSPR